MSLNDRGSRSKSGKEAEGEKVDSPLHDEFHSVIVMILGIVVARLDIARYYIEE